MAQVLDHHVGKPVKSVQVLDDRSTITFEDDAVINVPGGISQEVVGKALLLVDGDTLVFGVPQANSPSIRQIEIQVPPEEETEEPPQATETKIETKTPPQTAKKGVKGGRQSRSKGKRG